MNNGPLLAFKHILINIWSDNSQYNEFYFDNKKITFFYPDISNIPNLISKLSKLILFL